MDVEPPVPPVPRPGDDRTDAVVPRSWNREFGSTQHHLVSPSGSSADTAAWVAEQATREDVTALPRTAPAASVRLFATALVRNLHEALHSRTGQNPADVPLDLIDATRDAVHEGVSLFCLLNTVRIGHRLMVEQMAGTSERPTSGAGIVSTLSAFTDAASARITSAYVAETHRRANSLCVAAEMVRDLLAGHLISPSEAERDLGLDLTANRMAVIVWSNAESDLQREQLNWCALQLARALGDPDPLIVSGDPGEVWMWVTSTSDPTATLVVDARRTLSPPAGVRASIGPAAPGVEGFRRSHFGAQGATRVSRADHTQPWLVTYAEVAVGSLLTADPQHARWFAEESLGNLAAPGDRTAQLRETLRVYLLCARSRVEAAKILHVAPNTVAYRVERAAELVGHPISGDTLALRLALEIARTLIPSSDMPSLPPQPQAPHALTAQCARARTLRTAIRGWGLTDPHAVGLPRLSTPLEN